MDALGRATSAAYDMLAEAPASRWDADDAPGNLEASVTRRARHGVATLAMKGDRFRLFRREDVGRMDDFGVNAGCAEPSF